MDKTDETESMRLVMDKGLEHEAAHLAALKDRGLNVVEIQAEELAEKVKLTTEAIQNGADVVFQATLRRGVYIGHADFLTRTEQKGPSGLWVYEVVDTKLSHHTKTKFLVQLCFYSDLLADDHLSQVANITKTQIVKLASIGITTIKGWISRELSTIGGVVHCEELLYS